MNRSGKLNVLNNVDKLGDAIKEIKALEGLIDCDFNSGVLTYYLDEWASDYDLMVEIMNILERNNIDCEPYFDDETDIFIEKENSGEQCDDECESDGEAECDDEECERHHDEHHEHHEHHHDDGCCCGHNHHHEEGFWKANKSKIIELGIAVLILIAGFIFNAIPSVSVAAKYIMIMAYAVAGYETLYEAVANVFKKKFFSEQFLMSLASIAAIMLGEVSEAAGIMILFNVGELFEDGAIDNSRKVIESLKSMRPDFVTVINADGTQRKLKPEKVEVGSLVLCKAGEKIAIDGVVVEGNANLDTKAVTGESVYREASKGTEVFGGSINIDGVITIKTVKTYKESAVSKIMEIVESAQAKKSKSEKIVAKFSKVYTPIVVIAAILVAFVPPFFYESYSVGLGVWLNRAIMMLCVSCPCALVISVPLTYFCGIGAAAEKGILVKSSEYLEKLAKCKTVAFDKTGTLTTGEFTVTKIVSTKKFQGKVLYYAALAEKNSTHPIAESVRLKYGEDIYVDVENHRDIPGRGVSVTVNGQQILCGNAKLLLENNVIFNEIDELGVKLYVAVDGDFAGAIILNDTVRDNSYGAIMELYDAGIENTVMLTGDNKDYAVKIRKELNMRRSVSELLPDGKVDEIERLINETKNGTVAYVGDGINDAPVLSRADVGIAMGSLGSDAAIESADIVLTDDDLSKIPYTIKLAKRTTLIAKENIIVSLLIKFAIMILGVLGVTSSLWLAVGGDVGVMLLAVLNAIRNRRKVI